MKLDLPPAKELIVKDDGFGTWNWLKWFDVVYKILMGVNSEFIRTHSVDVVSTSTQLNDTHGTVVVDTDGLTITLPAASLDSVGNDWTIIFATTGTCTVQCSGADTFPAITSATETTASMVSRGESLTFRCTSSSTWGIV